ncbi:hypothetical protein [Bacillus sp. REN10]|uniref:hypothetical protein n=1 Tax=Bacillus sp. REN10 TaxID=2782541 RepID=UPI00193BC1F4|nr:hypothetical protein [Bacillus sp. REN10]
MISFIVFIGFVAMIVGIILLIKNLFKKQQKRNSVITIAAGFLVMFTAAAVSPETKDAMEEAKQEEQAKKEAEQIEKEERLAEEEAKRQEKEEKIKEQERLKRTEEEKKKKEKELAKKEAEEKRLAKEKEEAQALKNKSLGYNLDEFAKRFNAASDEFKSDFKINNPSVQSGKAQDVSQVTLNDNIILTITINKKDDTVRDVSMIGVGDGSQESALDILTVLGLIITTTNPDLSQNERGNVIKDLGLDGSDIIGKEERTTRNGIEYYLSASKEIGILFSASNENDK